MSSYKQIESNDFLNLFTDRLDNFYIIIHLFLYMIITKCFHTNKLNLMIFEIYLQVDQIISTLLYIHSYI